MLWFFNLDFVLAALVTLLESRSCHSQPVVWFILSYTFILEYMYVFLGALYASFLYSYHFIG